jgi:predicted Zn-dependent protease
MTESENKKVARNMISKIDCRLLIQSFDGDFDFLEDIGNQSKVIYKPRISSFKILPRAELPKTAITQKGDFISDFFIERIALKVPNPDIEKVKRHYESRKKMVYVEDIFEEMTRHWNYNSNEIFLGVIPYFIYGLMDTPNGQAERNVSMSIVSNFGLGKYRHEVAVGVGLHEIGHDLNLDHCKNVGCLMKAPGNHKDFYSGDYRLCEEHQKLIFKS